MLENLGKKYAGFLPKKYSTCYVLDIPSRQKLFKLTWTTKKIESLIIRDEGIARAAFLSIITVLKTLGYEEDLKVKRELSATGWYFNL